MKRRAWRILTLIGSVLSLTTFALGACAITCRPDWYDPPMIDYARLAQDKRDLTNTIERINVALNDRRPVTIELDERQVNRWIAARDEWPEDWYRFEIKPLRDPMIRFLDGNRIGLAALARRAGFGTVLSCVVRIELNGDQVRLYWEEASAGVLPAPRGLLARAVRTAPGTGEDLLAFLREGRLEYPNRWVWPNGKPRFRIRDLRIDDGRLRIQLEPR